MNNKYTENSKTLASATILMLLFIITLLFWGLNSGLDDNEAQTLWIVSDNASLSGSPREIGRALRDNLTQMSQRLSEQSQPPLYFVALDTWQVVAGDSIHMARMLSVLFVLLAISLTVIAARAFEPAANIIIMLLLACVLYFYPATTASTYSLLLLLSALSIFLLIRLHKHPTKFNIIAYTSALLAALYTHNIALPLLLLHGAFALHEKFFSAWWKSAVIALLLYVPWIAVPSGQIDDLQTLFVSGGWQTTITATIMVLLPLIIIRLDWLLALIANRRMTTRGRPYDVMLLAILIVVATLVNVGLLSTRPDWSGAIKTFNRSRRADEPILMAFDQKSPLAYYYRQDTGGISQGITVDIGWCDFSDDEIQEIVAAIDDTLPVWIIMPFGDERTAAAIDALAYNRWLAYRLEEGGILFYRFDYLPDDPRFE